MTVDEKNEFKNILDNATDDELLEYLLGLPDNVLAKVSFTDKVTKDKQFVDNFVNQYRDLINALCPKVQL